MLTNNDMHARPGSSVVFDNKFVLFIKLNAVHKTTYHAYWTHKSGL